MKLKIFYYILKSFPDIPCSFSICKLDLNAKLYRMLWKNQGTCLFKTVIIVYLCVLERNWLIQESSCLNTDCISEIEFVFNKLFKDFAVFSKTFPYIEINDTGRQFFDNCASFLWIGTTSAFFYTEGKLHYLKRLEKMYSSRLQLDSPQIFSTRILIISWPWALLVFKPEIILAMFP